MADIFGLCVILGVAIASPGCAHRSLHVSNAELEHEATALDSRGHADVTSSEGVRTRLYADEIVHTDSGDFRAGRWMATNCAPGGPCDLAGEGVTVERTDVGASLDRGVTIGGVSLIAGATIGAVACGVGAVCDRSEARLAGTVVLGGVAVLLTGGIIALGLCKTCFTVR